MAEVIAGPDPLAPLRAEYVAAELYTEPVMLELGLPTTYTTMLEQGKLRIQFETLNSTHVWYPVMSDEDKNLCKKRDALTASARNKLQPKSIEDKQRTIYEAECIRKYINMPAKSFASTLMVKSYGINSNINSARIAFTSNLRAYGNMNAMLGTNTSYFKWCPNDQRPDFDSHPRAVTRAERKSINAELYDFLEDMTSGKANSCVKKYENDGLRAWTALYLQYQDRADDQQNIIDLYMKDHFYFPKSDPEPYVNKFIFIMESYNSFWIRQLSDLNMRELFMKILEKSDISEILEPLINMRFTNAEIFKKYTLNDLIDKVYEIWNHHVLTKQKNKRNHDLISNSTAAEGAASGSKAEAKGKDAEKSQPKGNVTISNITSVDDLSKKEKKKMRTLLLTEEEKTKLSQPVKPASNWTQASKGGGKGKGGKGKGTKGNKGSFRPSRWCKYCDKYGTHFESGCHFNPDNDNGNWQKGGKGGGKGGNAGGTAEKSYATEFMDFQ